MEIKFWWPTIHWNCSSKSCCHIAYCRNFSFVFLLRYGMTSLILSLCFSTNYLILDGTSEVWKVDGAIAFARTQRGRNMLVFQGYKYVENRQSMKHIFWRCARYVKYRCRATVVTTKGPGDVNVRVAGAAHTHTREVPTDNIACADGKQ